MRDVAIVGFGDLSRHYVSQLPRDVEIWGQNQLYRSGFLPRAERWFELHSRGIFDTDIELRRPAGHVHWLKTCGMPVYMIDAWADIPNSVRYPIEDVVKDVTDYLTSSVAYMLALAILEKRSTIHLYGVDMVVEEYAGQRACVEYLMGLARGRGLKIILPEVSPLIKAPLYGRGESKPGGERLSDSQFTRRLESLKRRKQQLLDEQARTAADLNMIEGAMLEAEYWIHQTPEGPSQASFRASLQPSANGHVMSVEPLILEGYQPS